MEKKTQQEVQDGVNVLDLPQELQDELDGVIQPTKLELFLMLKDLANSLSSNDGQEVAKSSYRAGLGLMVISNDIVNAFSNHDNLIMKKVAILSQDAGNDNVISILKDTEDLDYIKRVDVMHKGLEVQFHARMKAQSKIGFD